MKTIVLLIALAGVSATGGYAQNKECSSYKRTTVSTIRQVSVIVPRVPVKNETPSCSVVKKENLGIPGCTDMVYDGDNSYQGYYFKTRTRTHKTVAIPRAKVIAVTRPAPLKTPLYKKVDQELLPCYAYRQHNILVKECPGTFYNNDQDPLIIAPVEYNVNRSYTGNYPQGNVPEQKESKQVESTNSPGDVLCFWNCR